MNLSRHLVTMRPPSSLHVRTLFHIMSVGQGCHKQAIAVHTCMSTGSGKSTGSLQMCMTTIYTLLQSSSPLAARAARSGPGHCVPMSKLCKRLVWNLTPPRGPWNLCKERLQVVPLIRSAHCQLTHRWPAHAVVP